MISESVAKYSCDSLIEFYCYSFGRIASNELGIASLTIGEIL